MIQKMDLLKTPSVQSLLDSDLESVDSLQYLDIEELDEVEYALPASEAPTLAEVLSTEDDECDDKQSQKSEDDPSIRALQVEHLPGVSNQLLQAQERSTVGAATALSVGVDGKLTLGTGHGHLLSFHEQTLRWVCNLNADRGAVSSLSYNKDSTRLLAGYARGLICQYESVIGTILRRITLGGEIWGILRVTWADMSGLALDTGGSVWLIKFSRPLGVRSARSSCIFSGARGEVVAMKARDARILALATLSRIIIVAGGRAAGLRLSGPPDTLPVLEWSETDERVLVCARGKTLQWLSLNITGSSISLRPIHRIDLHTTPLWIGWLTGQLAIFDTNENLQVLGEQQETPVDLSHAGIVYASAFFKGYWTDGRVSRAMCKAGVSALGGACVVDGSLWLLCRQGVLRVRPRDLLTRAHALFFSGRDLQALRLLSTTQGTEAKALAIKFVNHITENPHIVSKKQVADQVVKLCLKYNLGEQLWGSLWEQCSSERAFVEALGDAAVRDELSTAPPSPDSSQDLIERLAEFEPGLVERVVASLPFTSLDPHRASVFTREKGLWRGVGAIAAALGGSACALRELCAHVDARCDVRRGGSCACAGAALVVAAADALAGRAAGGRALPDHARPSARHDALQALLADEGSSAGVNEGTRGGVAARSPLRVMVEHEAGAAVRLLEQNARDAPFAGPLAKHNRLRVARALLSFAPQLPEPEDRAEILEFIIGQLNSNALPPDQEVIKDLDELAAITYGERADRAWLSLVTRAPPGPVASRATPARLESAAARAAVAQRPRVLWRLYALLDRHDDAMTEFFKIDSPSKIDVEELFEYLRPRVEAADDVRHQLDPYLHRLIELSPRSAASLLNDNLTDSIAACLRSRRDEAALELGESLREAGRLRAEAAAAHLRNLCVLRPARARSFLLENVGLVRPEEALDTVREVGPPDAEPACLEAAGDPGAALDALLRLAAGADPEAAAKFMAEAGELCARVAPTVPPTVAASMWTRLLKSAGAAPPALLLEAVAYLPIEETFERACESPRVALAVLACATSRRGGWQCLARISGQEAHEALARALTAAQRGVAVRGRCARCGRRLADRAPVLTGHCARAFHAECELESRCGACGVRLPDAAVEPPARAARRTSLPAPDFDLRLVAPPRPDLEGVV